MRLTFHLLLLLALAGGILQAAPLDTAISYQGRMDDSGAPANGTYSFGYRLLGDLAGTTQIGPVVDVPKVTDNGKAQGAILGKAMGALADGKSGARVGDFAVKCVLMISATAPCSTPLSLYPGHI